jgi:sulfur carrier protein
MMQVRVNGKTQAVPDGATVEALVEQLKLQSQRLAVEVNQELVTQARWQQFKLKPDDRVEIVSFVGGG